MLALVLDGTPRVDPDHPEPSCAPGESLVRVRTAGVCDTDVQLAHGYLGFRGVPGHEVVGEVLESDDASFLGRRVVADINAGCGACDDCRERDGHHCRARTVLGIVGRAGAFAERFAIPTRCLVAVPDGVSDDVAVFAEPLAAALHVLDDARDARRAVVVGDGKLGLLIALALAPHVTTCLVGHHERKLALARAAGIDASLEDSVPPSFADADLVVEATGNERGLTRALSLVRPRGTVVMKTTVAAPLTGDLAPVVIHELRLVGSRCGDLRRAVDTLAQRTIDPSPLIEARYPLSRADEALRHASRRGALKILLDA